MRYYLMSGAHPRPDVDGKVEAVDDEALRADDGAELPDADVGAGEGAVGDVEDDEALVHGVHHVQPEGVGLVHLAQPPVRVQVRQAVQERVGNVLVEHTFNKEST